MNAEQCLAATGDSAFFIAVVAAGMLLASVALVMFVRYKQGGSFALKHMVIGLFVLPLAFSASLPAAASAQSADDRCVAIAAPDQSTGAQGQVQTFNVLANDTPSAGASFDAASLRLMLPESPLPGTVLAVDGKTMTAPGEGVYAILSGGIIQFTPESDFTGLAHGVRYTITDTNGATATGLYRPMVYAAVAETCTEPTNYLAGTSINIHDGDWGSASLNLAYTSMSDSEFSPDNSLAYVYSGSVYKTTDGVSATQLFHLPKEDDPDNPVGYGTSIIGIDVNGPHMAVASSRYVYTSNDNGQTWNSHFTGTHNIDGVAISADGQTIFASAWNYFVVSTDGGATWTEKPFGFSSDDIRISADGTRLFARDYFDGELWQSSDNGDSWTSIGAPVTDERYTAFDISDDGQTIAYLGVGPSSTNWIAVSTDGGITWSAQESTVYSDVTVSGDGQVVMTYGTGNNWWASGYDTSTDGGNSWDAHNDGEDYSDVSLSADGSRIAANVSWLFLLSFDGGTMWTDDSPRLYDPMLIDIDPYTPGIQHEIDRTEEEGWGAVYDPSMDAYTFTSFDSGAPYQLFYALYDDSSCQVSLPSPIDVTYSQTIIN